MKQKIKGQAHTLKIILVDVDGYKIITFYFKHQI